MGQAQQPEPSFRDVAAKASTASPQVLFAPGRCPLALSNLAVVGMGPVGLAAAVAFATEGHRVVGLDRDEKRVELIARGRTPFYEPGLQGALSEVVASGHFDTTMKPEVAAREADFVFLCVGTPSRQDGSMDESLIRRATQDVVAALPLEADVTFVVKSTVIPGTTETVIRPMLQAPEKNIRVAVNPEFLREGHALEDSRRPDRVVLGVEEREGAEDLKRLYSFVDCPIFETDLRTAEAVKYATNAFLATKIAYANEMANLCRAFGVEFDDVISGVALDPRINPRFLRPGVGFGGSCFPKDLSALVAAGKAHDSIPRLLQTVIAENEVQYRQAILLLREELGELKGRRIALLGLAFKGGTDDVRESRSVLIAKDLVHEGATVVGYDPVAMVNFRDVAPEVLTANTVAEALEGSDGCILQADWDEFSALTAEDFLSSMRTPVVIDGRRILDPTKMDGVRFRRIG